MSLSYPVFGRSRSVQSLAVLLLLMSLLLTSACEGNAQIRQRAMDSQSRFSRLLHSAQQLGFTTDVLQPVLAQAAALHSMSAPASLASFFSNQPADSYYQALNQRYQHLTSQLQDLMVSSTAQIRTKIALEVQETQALLNQERKAGLPAQNFAAQLTQLQAPLSHAQNFGNYATVYRGVHDVHLSLRALASTSDRLDALKNILALSQQAHLTVTASMLQTDYQHDQQLFLTIADSLSLQKLGGAINGQYQQAAVAITQAIPTIVSTRLDELNRHIQNLSSAHIAPDPYQARFTEDKKLAAVPTSMTVSSFQRFLQQVDRDIYTVQADVLLHQGNEVINQFHQDVNTWSNSHLYYDQYDGRYYAVDTSYLNDNFGLDADVLFKQATSLDELQQALATAKALQFNHQLMEIDAADYTPYDQIHKADVMALQHYQLQKGQVIVVSLSGQALRLYQDGALVQSFLVTTGRAERPSPPGIWPILNRLSPTIFKSDDPPSSPYWYPKTHINYAILIRDGGYFIHDSWWRATYGPNTEFPHVDATGDQRDAGNGSHGCVNLTTPEANWLYNNTNWNTTVVIY